MTTRFRRIAQNTLYNIGTGVVSSAALFLTSVVVARALGPSDTGLYALVNFSIFALTTIAANGLAFSVAKFVAQYDGASSRDLVSAVAAFGQRAGLAAAVGLALLLAALSSPIAAAFGEPESGELFLLAAVVAVPSAMTRMVAAPLQGLQRQAVFLPLALIQGVLIFLGTLAVLGAGGGVAALLLVQLAVAVVVLALHYLALRPALPDRSRGSLGAGLRSRVFSYGASVTGMSALDLIVWQRSEVVFLGVFRDSREVAFYSIAFALAEALQQIVPSAVGNALFPNLSRAFEVGDRRFLQRAYHDSIRFLVLVTTPVAVAGSVLAAPAVGLVYGEAFLPAAVAVQILLFSAGAHRVGIAFSSVLYAADRERLMLATTVGWAALNVALAVTLIPPFGVLGAALANAITQLVAIAAGPLIVRRVLSLAFPTGDFLRVALPAVPMGLTVWAASLIGSDLVGLLLGALVAGPSYAGGLLLAGALREGERKTLGAALRRAVGGRRDPPGAP